MGQSNIQNMGFELLLLFFFIFIFIPVNCSLKPDFSCLSNFVYELIELQLEQKFLYQLLEMLLELLEHLKILNTLYTNLI